jgi:hypothetical protein
MALNIPNTDLPGTSFLKGLDSGSNMFAKMMNAKYNNSLHPSGDVANALYVEQLRNQYGENDPRYLEAKKSLDLISQSRQSLIGYRDILNQTAGIRYSSPLGKLIAEGKGQGAQDILANRNAQNANAPADARYKVGEQYYNAQGDPVDENKGNPKSSEEKQAYEQAIGKQTTDAAIRNKIPYAENVKITMDNINPDDLVQFSGLKGHLRLGIETLKAAAGNPSEEYLAYQTAVTGAQTLKKQLRQFWGDSIQPAATEEIGKLTNPSTWSKNPKVAKQQFEQLKKITNQELESFTKHGTSPVKLDYDSKSGQFTVDKGENKPENKSALQKKVEGSAKKPNKIAISSEDRNIAKQVSKQVIDVLPKATAENIIATVKASGKSIDEVVQHLVDQADRMRQGVENG